jgi:hypothetical protein
VQCTIWKTSAHREIPCAAVGVLQNLDPLVALGHAEEVALNVGLALGVQQNKRLTTTKSWKACTHTHHSDHSVYSSDLVRYSPVSKTLSTVASS